MKVKTRSVSATYGTRRRDGKNTVMLPRLAFTGSSLRHSSHMHCDTVCVSGRQMESTFCERFARNLSLTRSAVIFTNSMFDRQNIGLSTFLPRCRLRVPSGWSANHSRWSL